MNKDTRYPQKTRYGADSNPNLSGPRDSRNDSSEIPHSGLIFIDNYAAGSCLSRLVSELSLFIVPYMARPSFSFLTLSNAFELLYYYLEPTTRGLTHQPQFCNLTIMWKCPHHALLRRYLDDFTKPPSLEWTEHFFKG